MLDGQAVWWKVDSAACRVAAPVQAKYGDESQFFDLDVSSIYLSSLVLPRLCPHHPIRGRVHPPWQAVLTLHRLQDLENTAGSWDLYGQQDERRYPGLQAEFFERAAAPLTRRESVYAFVTAGTAVGLCWSANSTAVLSAGVVNQEWL